MNYKTLSTITLRGRRITLLELASGQNLETSENHFILKTVHNHKPEITEFFDSGEAKIAYLNLVAYFQ